MTHEDLVKAIQAFAKKHGISPEHVGRDAFRREDPAGRTRYASTGFNWSKAKAAAIGPLAPDVPPVDPIPPRHIIKGVSTLIDPEGNTVLQWVKTRSEQETREEALARLVRDLPTVVPPRVAKVAKPAGKRSKDVLAVYPLGDPHIGMLSWGEETGTDFDLPKAQSLLCKAIDNLVSNAPEASEALVVNLGDYFHSDSQENRTRRSGHQLDVDSRWAKVLKVGLETMIYLIDRCLAVHDTVHVINEIGNHDDHSAVFLSVALSAYYRNESRVSIDLSPSRFHYFRFGKVLIGVTHGDGAKQNSLESIMAADRAKEWGETKHRYWLIGHIHTSRKFEYRGCTVESFRTLAPPDAWASGAGYRSGRDMHRIVYHREYGEISRSIVSADYLEAQYKK